jgi:hypothetical protein
MNEACLIKLDWKLKNGDNALWCSVLKGKYDRSNISVNMMIAKPSDSSLWKNLVHLWPAMCSMVR